MRRWLFKNAPYATLSRSLNNVGCALEAAGRVEEGLKLQQEALEICRRLFKNADHADLASSLNNVGCALKAAGRVEEGLKLQQEARMGGRLFENDAHTDLV